MARIVRFHHSTQHFCISSDPKKLPASGTARDARLNANRAPISDEFLENLRNRLNAYTSPCKAAFKKHGIVEGNAIVRANIYEHSPTLVPEEFLVEDTILAILAMIGSSDRDRFSRQREEGIIPAQHDPCDAFQSLHDRS